MGNPSLKAGKVFSSSISILSFLIIAITPAAAFPAKNARPTLLSPKLIPAKAAIVVDTNKSVIYAKNSEAKLPPASTTKLITAMVVLDHLSPFGKVRISQRAARVHSIKPRLRPNEELTVKDLLHLALMKSVNSAAVALAEGTSSSEKEFVELMNQKAQAIGAGNTRFANSSGLPGGVQYTTVYDLTVILSEALTYPTIKEILGKKECSLVTPQGKSLPLKNTDKLLWASDNMIGGKTGYTDKAQHCFVGAYQTGGGPIYTAVLGTTSRSKLWKSTELLFDLGTQPQGIAPAGLTSNKDGREIKNRSVKLKKGRRIRHLSEQKHEEPAIKLALK